MKKTLLLATTAIVSAFALNVKAEPISYSGDVTLEATVELVYTVTSETVQKLDFGKIAYVPGATYKVGADGTTSENSNAQQFGTPKNGIVKITSQASAVNNGSTPAIRLVLPEKINMYKGSSICGEVTQLTQGTLTSSGPHSYDIPFGGTFTIATTVLDGLSGKGPITSCSGSATATLVYEP